MTLTKVQESMMDINVPSAVDVGLNTSHRNTTTGNPHNVSKGDIGLGNVTNDAQVKASQLETVLTNDDSKVPTSGAVFDAIGEGGGSGISNEIIVSNYVSIEDAFAAANDGDTIRFTAGTYTLTTNISINKRVHIVGSGATISCPNTASGITISGAKASISGLYFEGTRDDNQTAITVDSSYITVNDILIIGCGRGIFVKSGVWHRLENIRLRNISKTVLEIGGPVVGCVVNDLKHDVDTAYESAANQPDHGILLYGEGCQFSDLDLIHSGKCLHIVGTSTGDPGGNVYTDWNFFNQCYFDKSVYGAYIDSSNSGYGIRGVVFDQCWFSTHDECGLVTTGSYLCNGITLNNCHFLNSVKGAIRLYGSADTTLINGCVFAGNCQGSGSYSDIVCSTTGKTKVITNNFFGNWGSFGSSIKAEIEISASDGATFFSHNTASTYASVGHVIGDESDVIYGINFNGFPTNSSTSNSTELFNDKSPQLGANLDLNGYNITDDAYSLSMSDLNHTYAYTHTQGTDTSLGTMSSNINMNNNSITNLAGISGSTINVSASSTINLGFSGGHQLYMNQYTMSPTTVNGYSLGDSSKPFGTIHVTNLYDSGVLQDSQDDLAVMSEIQPMKNSDGETIVDERSGFELIDLASLPEHLTNKSELLEELNSEMPGMFTEEDFEEMIRDHSDDGLAHRLRRNSGAFHDLTSGAVRQLDKEVIGMFELLCQRIHNLEEIVKKLK